MSHAFRLIAGSLVAGLGAVSLLAVSSTSAQATADKFALPHETVTVVTAPVTTTSTILMPTTTTPEVAVSALATKQSVDAMTVNDAQRKLIEIGYWLGSPDGKLGVSTQQALLAFQKVNGLDRSSALDAATKAALVTAARPTARTSGDGVEIDKTHQVIFVVRGGDVLWTFNTSTGTENSFRSGTRTGFAHTPEGTFTFNRQVNASDPGPLGNLYRPKYFTNDGIAVHGASQVPAYAASHGCARVTNAAMDFIWAQNLMPLQTTVTVYQ